MSDNHTFCAHSGSCMLEFCASGVSCEWRLSACLFFSTSGYSSTGTGFYDVQGCQPYGNKMSEMRFAP